MAFSKHVTPLLLLTYSILAAASRIHVARDLDSFIASEKPKAVQGILANIGSNGTLSQGAKQGVGMFLLEMSSTWQTDCSWD